MTGSNLRPKASAKTSSAVASRARSSDSAARGPSFTLKTTKSTLSKQTYRAIKVYHDFDENTSKHTSDNFTNRRVAALRKSLDSACDAFALSPSAATARTFRESARSIVDYQKKIEINTVRAELESNTRKLVATLKKIEQRLVSKLQNVDSMVRSKISGCCDSISTAGIIADVFLTASQEAAYIAGSIPSVDAPAHVGAALTFTIESAPLDIQQALHVESIIASKPEATPSLENQAEVSAEHQLDPQAGPVEIVEVAADSEAQSSLENQTDVAAVVVSMLYGAEKIEKYAASLKEHQDKRDLLLEFVEVFRAAVNSCGKIIDTIETPQAHTESTCRDLSTEMQHFIPLPDRQSLPAGSLDESLSGNSKSLHETVASPSTAELCNVIDGRENQEHFSISSDMSDSFAPRDASVHSLKNPKISSTRFPSSSLTTPTTPTTRTNSANPSTPSTSATSSTSSTSSTSTTPNSLSVFPASSCLSSPHGAPVIGPEVDEESRVNRELLNSQLNKDCEEAHFMYWADYCTIHPLSGRPICLHCNPGAKYDTRSLDIGDVFDKHDTQSEMVRSLNQRIEAHRSLLAEVAIAAKEYGVEPALEIYFSSERQRSHYYYKEMEHHLQNCPHLRLTTPLIKGIMNSLSSVLINIPFMQKWSYDAVFRANYASKNNLCLIQQRLSFIINKLNSEKYRITSHPEIKTGADYIKYKFENDTASLPAWSKAVSHNVHRLLDVWPDNEGRTVLWYKKGSEEERAQLVEYEKTCSIMFSDKVALLRKALLGKPMVFPVGRDVPLPSNYKSKIYCSQKTTDIAEVKLPSSYETDMAALMSDVTISKNGRVSWV